MNEQIKKIGHDFLIKHKGISINDVSDLCVMAQDEIEDTSLAHAIELLEGELEELLEEDND